MNAKSCLHCGRSLARIRVGAGGDFCCREHRNEYRLRRSMDCLAEGDRLATLARRRETPKPVFAEPAAGLANAVPRALEAKADDRGPGAKTQMFLPEVSRAPWPGAEAGDRGRESEPVWPQAHGLRTPAGPQPIPTPYAASRDFGFAPWPAHEPCAPDGNRPEWRPARPMRTPASAGSVAPPPMAGNALRVSASAAIRPGRLEIPRASATTASPKTGLKPDARLRTLELVRREAPAARLAYTELAFTAAPDGSARPEWIGKAPGGSPGQE